MVRYLAFAAAAVMLLAGAAWFLRPAQYEAFALLRVSSKSPAVLAQTAAAAGEDFSIFKRTQVQLILSGPVLNGAVREPTIAALPIIERQQGDAVTWLRDHLIVDYPDDSEIMRVALRGPNRDELVKIVDAVVKKYLTEIVQAAREGRLEQENKLEKKYNEIFADFSRQAEALHTMEQVAKTQSTQAAEIRRKLTLQDLDDAVATRNYLKRQLLENELKINLMKVKAEKPPESRTADTGADDPSKPAAAAPAANDPDSTGLTLPVLEKQREFLRERLAEANAQIEETAKAFDTLEQYSAGVTAKQEELIALKQIMSQIKAELDRTKVERLAQERITKVDDAFAVSSRRDLPRRYAGLAIAVFLSLGLVLIGLAAGRRGAS